MKYLFFSVLLLIVTDKISARVKLPKLISNGMVLQRNKTIKVWGWANDGEKVTINFQNYSYTTNAVQNGNWQVQIPAMNAGGPFEMKITGENEIIIKDILIGEVWVCSGQSNMEMKISKVKKLYDNDIKQSSNQNIRFFNVSKKYSFKELNDVDGNWAFANPISVLEFSAVAYFYTTNFYKHYKIPIGIISTSWGGTPAEAWMSVTSLKEFPEDIAKAQFLQNNNNLNALIKQNKDITNEWYVQLQKNDKGLFDESGNWASINNNFKDWQNIYLPNNWESQKNGPGNIDGVVWFKKEIRLSNLFLNKDAFLELGLIDDEDSTYINGNLIGFTTNKHEVRRYKIPINTLKEGINIITIRVVDKGGIGGIIKGKSYQLYNNQDTVLLEGNWIYKIGVISTSFPAEQITTLFYQPTALYNSMIAPLTNYTIKGILWYQGEANSNNAKKYDLLMTNMILDWRIKWQIPNFPFLIVQLPNFTQPKEQPIPGNWTKLREAQSSIVKHVINTGLVVTIDIGETYDIHPSNKKDVGYRLFLASRKTAYNEIDIITSGPEFKDFKIEDDKIVLSFNSIGIGLVAKGTTTELNQFAIAGNDKKFVWANAYIQGDKVVVYNNLIKNPVAVRYAWTDNPLGCNLYNEKNLPAAPFRTDNW